MDWVWAAGPGWDSDKRCRWEQNGRPVALFVAPVKLTASKPQHTLLEGV